MSDSTQARPVLVVDFGAQYAQLIARRVREAGVYSEIVPHTVTAEEIRARNPVGIVLSGGPSSVYEEGAPSLDADILGLGVPTMGEVVLRQVDPLERRSSPWQEFAPTELNHQQVCLSRTERLRFLSGYLQHPRGKRRVKALLAIPRSASPERQAVP